MDLARTAGVSTQQVRNLEAAGALPEAERSESGYRRYDERHLAALLAYTALVPGLGAQAARAIVAAVGEDRTKEALELVDAAHAALHQGRASLLEIERTLSAVVNQEPATDAPDGLRVGALARLLGVRTSALRVWEAAGLLAPSRESGTGYRLYGARDVRDARIIQTLRESSYMFDRIRPIIDGLRRTGGSEALLEALAERRRSLDERSAALLEGAARLWGYVGMMSSGVMSPMNTATWSSCE
ncbi:MerR family transcriptional regulator [Catenulispora acidiphila]|uniref:MerR family transcriptional regulator n=1 Tax=Catenulispora acidiphila TaxID=304895 RepID=UPI001CC0E147|nr:MerR family transcriptional regulator [Catenulispora acidiphila]